MKNKNSLAYTQRLNILMVIIDMCTQFFWPNVTIFAKTNYSEYVLCDIKLFSYKNYPIGKVELIIYGRKFV